MTDAIPIILVINTICISNVIHSQQNLEQNALTARVLADALPFIQAYADKTVVIKYGGHAMENAEASLSFARDVVMLKQVQN